MSYNITKFKVKELNELMMPLSSFYKHEREDWHPTRTNNDDGTVSIEGFMGVHGTLNGENLVVNDIDCQGEGSGTDMNWILEPALKDSKGKLIVTCIWEGGDSVNQLVVTDGIVVWSDIDI